MLNLSNHAEQRIRTRLNGLVTTEEVTERVNRFHITEHRYFIEVKRMPYTEVKDDSVKPDGIARGNQIVAICDSGKIESVILRKRESISPEYRKIYSKPK